MSAQPAEPTPPATTEPPAAAATPPAPAAPKPTEPPKAADPAPRANPWEDPAAAEAEIKRLRAENAKDRTAAKAQAAAEAKKELLKSLGLGDEDETDPAKLTQDLAAERKAAQRARVELAVFKMAAAANGDPRRLLTHTGFLESLESIDPTDTAAVQAAIESAVEANPWLGAAPAGPTPPAPNPAQGASAGGAPGLEAQIAEATKAGNFQLAIALKQQRAAELRDKK